MLNNFSKKYAKNLVVPIFCVPLHPRLRKTHKSEQNGAVVQLVRISACHAGGRGFESRPHRKKSSSEYLMLILFERAEGLTKEVSQLILFENKEDERRRRELPFGNDRLRREV